MLARADALEALRTERFDVVVVGGGITGAGVALDAASRGMRVALVERDDYASGTSSRSSKLVHGGLRYLRTLDLGLVREALLERRLLAALAPHLVTPLPLVVAAFDGARRDLLTGVGLHLYDLMALGTPGGWGPGGRPRRGRAGWSPDRHRAIGAAEALELLPALARRPPTAGYLFYDCQTDDVRLVLTVLSEAERFGAVCANGLEVIELRESSGHVDGVTVRDGASGEEVAIDARHVVSATGVWANRLWPDATGDDAAAPSIRPSRGTHVLLRSEDVPLVAGAIVPAGGGRSIFALPWLGRTLVGTTDEDHTGGLDPVVPAEADIAYLLDAVNAYARTSLTPDDVVGAFAGARPLIDRGHGRRSVDLSRGAELFEAPGGMVTMTGGKLTTYRRMAKATVDLLVKRDGRRAPCRTAKLPLGRPIAAAELAAAGNLPETVRAHLAARYGDGAHVVARIAREAALAAPILDGFPDPLAEAVHAARGEQARSLADVLLRRTRLGLLDARAALRQEPLDRLAGVLAAELGWSDAERTAQVAGYRADAEAEGLAP